MVVLHDQVHGQGTLGAELHVLGPYRTTVALHEFLHGQDAVLPAEVIDTAAEQGAVLLSSTD